MREREPLRDDIEAGLALGRLSTGLPVGERLHCPSPTRHARVPVGVRLPPPPKILGTNSPKSVSWYMDNTDSSCTEYLHCIPSTCENVCLHQTWAAAATNFLLIEAHFFTSTLYIET